MIRERASQDDGVVFFDLTGYDLEGYNKFIPYYLFPESLYTVSVSPSSFRTKVSVGRILGAGAVNTTWRAFASATAAAVIRGGSDQLRCWSSWSGLETLRPRLHKNSNRKFS